MIQVLKQHICSFQSKSFNYVLLGGKFVALAVEEPLFDLY